MDVGAFIQSSRKKASQLHFPALLLQAPRIPPGTDGIVPVAQVTSAQIPPSMAVRAWTRRHQTHTPKRYIPKGALTSMSMGVVAGAWQSLPKMLGGT